jgi:hypothetical protein
MNGVTLRQPKGKDWRLSEEIGRLGAGPREDTYRVLGGSVARNRIERRAALEVVGVKAAGHHFASLTSMAFANAACPRPIHRTTCSVKSSTITPPIMASGVAHTGYDHWCSIPLSMYV